jgi:hypothetical protein
MKNIMKVIYFFSVMILILISSSCVTTKFTHQQVMDNAVNGKSKGEIITTFGLPTQKQVEGNYEQWVYDLGQQTITLPRPSLSNTNVNVSPYSNSATIRTNSYGGGSISETYNKYVKIVLQNDIGFKWETAGVDYAITEPNPVGTTFYVLGVVGGGILLGVLLALL